MFYRRLRNAFKSNDKTLSFCSRDHMSQDAARRCIEILGTEFEKWNSVGEKLLVGRMEHNLATTIVKSYITGIAQPGRIVQDDPFQQQPDTVDLGRVGALFNRVDSVNTTLSRMDFEMHRAKRVKMQTNAEIAQLLLGLSAIGLVQSPASFEDRSMATAVPSIREDLQRAKTQVKALTFDALNKMAPLLRKRQHLVAIEQSGDTEAYGNGAFDLAQELLWRNAVCTTEVRQLTFTTKDMFNQVKRTDVEFMDYLLSGLNTRLLLDYHFQEQGFAYESRDGSIAVSHITMGMESGTQADMDSTRACPDAALECARREASVSSLSVSFLTLPCKCLQDAAQIAGRSSHFGNGFHWLRAHHAGPPLHAYPLLESEGWHRGGADESG